MNPKLGQSNLKASRVNSVRQFKLYLSSTIILCEWCIHGINYIILILLYSISKSKQHKLLICCLRNMTSFPPTSWRDYSLRLYVRCKIISRALLNYSDPFVTCTLLNPLITYGTYRTYIFRHYICKGTIHVFSCSSSEVVQIKSYLRI